MDKRFNAVLIAGLLAGNEELAAEAVRLLKGTRKKEWQQFCDADLLKGLLDGCAADVDGENPAILVDIAAGYSLPKNWRGTGRGMRALPAIMSHVEIDLQSPSGRFHQVAEYSPAHCFPVARESGGDDACRRQLWSAKDRLGELDARGGFPAFYTRLLALLQRYTWCLPASHRPGVDVPLYEDLRVTSAICACLYQYHEEAGWKRLRDDTIEKFLLLAGDMVGVQNYVFGLASAKGVAGRLRARSFYINSLARAVALKVLDELGLPPANLLVWAAGTFCLLLPRTAQCGEKLARLLRGTEEYLLDEFAGDIGLATAETSLSGRDLQTFDETSRRSAEALAAAKLAMFRHQLIRGGKWRPEAFLRPRTITAAVCPGCRHDDAGPGEYCPQCARDEALGTRLAGADWLVYRKEAAAGSYELLPGLHMEAAARHPADTAGVLLAERIDGGGPDGWDGPVSFRSLANHVPLAPGEPGRILTFQEIAGRARGEKLLAYLKADVDNMGSVYLYGLRREAGGLPVTVTRLAALSGMFDVFFNGWLENLLAGEFTDCYAIFGGGDGLFVAGPWNEVLDLAARLAHDFGRFTGGNTRITLSAGILPARPDLPVSSAYRLVEELLDYARKGGEEPGSRLAVFGRLIKWHALPGALEQGKKLAGWLDEGVAQTSFVRRLAAYGTMHRRYSEDNDVRGLSFLPLLCNDIVRNLPPPDSRGERAAYRGWAESLVHGGSPDHAGLKSLWFAAAYALAASQRPDCRL